MTGSFPPAWSGGGVPVACYQLTKALMDLGHRVFTISDNSDEGTRMDVQVNTPISWGQAPVIYVDRFKSDFEFARDLKRTATDLASEYDVILSRGNWRLYNFIARLVSAAVETPYILFPEGIFDPWAWGHRWWKKRPYWWLIERRNYRIADAIVALSEIEAKQVRELVGDSRIEVIPNGVQLPDLKGVRPQLDLSDRIPELSEDKWILFLSRIHPKKGIDILIKGFSQVAEDFPGFRLVIAGDGDPEYVRYLKQIARREGVGSRVVWPGFVKGQLKDALFRQADVFALTSHSEGLPVAVLEALAYGVPALVTPQCNLPEIIDFEAGLCVEGGPQQVAEGLERLLLNKYERQQMGVNGRRLVKDCFSWESAAQKVVKLCQELTDEH